MHHVDNFLYFLLLYLYISKTIVKRGWEVCKIGFSWRPMEILNIIFFVFKYFDD